MVLGLVFLTIAFVGIRSAHRSLIGESQDFRTSRVPWLRVAAGLSSSVLVASIAHQREFPDRFSTARVVGADGKLQCGLYLGATSDAIVLGQTRGPFGSGTVCDGQPRTDQASTMLVARARIEQLILTTGPDLKPPASSLLRRLGVPLDCVSLDCQIGSERHGILQPFDGDSP